MLILDYYVTFSSTQTKPINLPYPLSSHARAQEKTLPFLYGAMAQSPVPPWPPPTHLRPLQTGSCFPSGGGGMLMIAHCCTLRFGVSGCIPQLAAETRLNSLQICCCWEMEAQTDLQPAAYWLFLLWLITVGVFRNWPQNITLRVIGLISSSLLTIVSLKVNEVLWSGAIPLLIITELAAAKFQLA